MANIQSLVNYNSNQNQADAIFKDLVDSFSQLRIAEQQKDVRNDSIIQFCKETAACLQKKRNRFGNAELEDLSQKWAAYKEPVLDELEASQFAETSIKLHMEKQNRRQINRNSMEFQTAFPQPEPVEEAAEGAAQRQHQNIYVNQKADLIDPKVFPYPVHNFYTAKDFIVTKGELKYYVDPINPINAPRLLRFSGTMDLEEVMANILIYDSVIDQVDILVTLERLILIGEKRGYSKVEHLTLIMRHILKLHFENVFTTYNSIYEPELLFETLKGLHRPYETRTIIDRAIRSLIRKPNETISSVSTRLESLNVKKFKLEKNTSNPIERARRAAQILILNFVTAPVRAEIENFVKAKSSFGDNPSLDEILDLIETLESNRENRPSTDLMITESVKHLFAVQTRGSRAEYHVPTLQDRAHRTRYSSRTRYEERARQSPRRIRNDNYAREEERGRRRNQERENRYSTSRSITPSIRRREFRSSYSRSRDRYGKRNGISKDRNRTRSVKRSPLTDKEREIIQKLKKDVKCENVKCIRCFSGNHSTTECRRYVSTSPYICTCNEGFHYRNKCLRKSVRRESTQNYRNESRHSPSKYEENRQNSKTRLSRSPSRNNNTERRRSYSREYSDERPKYKQRYNQSRSMSPRSTNRFSRQRSPSSGSRH